MVRGCERVLPGCSETSNLPKGATLGTPWLHEPQPISKSGGMEGVPHRAGRYRPGDHRFRPRNFGIVDV